MIPVVELLRVSTDLQAGPDRAGLPGQHSTNLRTCGAYGLEIVESVEIVESGAEVARTPGMARVLEAVTSGRARGILLAEYSRLFRPDRWSDLVVLQTLSDHGAPIYLPAGPIDLATELGFVQATINNLLAAMERRRIRERMDRGKEEHRRRGAHVAGGVGIPFGMRYSREDGWQWTEDAGTVRELFRRFLAGEHNLDALGRSLGLPRTSTKFLLQNPVYTGWRVYAERRDPSPAGKYRGGDRRRLPRRPEEVIRVRLPVEPLVSDDDFAQVQALLTEKRTRRVRRSRDDVFLYRGFLRCAEDQLAMYTKTTTPGGRERRFYQCRSFNPSRAPEGVARCSTGHLVAEKIERELDHAIRRRLLDPDVLVAALGEYAASMDARWRAPAEDAASLAQRLTALESKRVRVLESYYEGLISKGDRDRRLAPLAEEVAALQRRMGTPAAAVPAALEERALVALLTTFAEWTHVEHAGRRSILEALQPTFYVGKYHVAGVRFPLASLSGGNTDSHSPAAGVAPPARCAGTPAARP